MGGTRATALDRRTVLRTGVHLALITTALVSLVLEPVLAIHIGLGLTFVGLVVVHIVQRRRTTATLVGRLIRVRSLPTRSGRLALADLVLAALTAAMLASGIWDWAIGHPTAIRWHAITGVLLAGFLVVHTLRRRRSLTHSAVR